MPGGVKEKVIEAIYEIFVNAQIHSETQLIYTCSQFFPNKTKSNSPLWILELVLKTGSTKDSIPA